MSVYYKCEFVAKRGDEKNMSQNPAFAHLRFVSGRDIGENGQNKSQRNVTGFEKWWLHNSLHCRDCCPKCVKICRNRRSISCFSDYSTGKKESKKDELTEKKGEKDQQNCK